MPNTLRIRHSLAPDNNIRPYEVLGYALPGNWYLYDAYIRSFPNSVNYANPNTSLCTESTDHPLSNHQELLDLVGDIYEASCDANHWVGVMQKVTEATGSKSAMLAYRDLEQPQASFQFSYNISQEILELYAHKYSAIDPFFELSAKTVPLGKTSADHKMVPDR